MKNKGTLTILFIITILILLGIFAAIELVDLKNNKENVKVVSTNNEIKSTIKNNTVKENNDANEVEQNNIIVNNQTNNKEEIDNESMQKEEKNKEEAIRIVKENWGEDDTVYFSYDSIDSDGNYLVCVRDKETTNALYWYKIDLETGTFTIE